MDALVRKGEVAAAFTAETARLRASGSLGDSGRLRELFDYLADRGPASESATQSEIAAAVFGQRNPESDDPTVRVYIHRLRKRLEEFYAGEGRDGPHGQLVIPAGSYALRIDESSIEEATRPPSVQRPGSWVYLLIGLLALGAAFLAGRQWSGGEAPEVNAIWQPFVNSSRPLIIVVGDYYIFGEIDPVRPEEGRLIRDFSIDSPTDLARAQQLNPDRYGYAEDVGLNYLPFSAAYGLDALVPVLAQHRQPVTVMPASEVTSDTLRNANVVYIGLVSGMHLIEDVNFMSSGFVVGESYDELTDSETGRKYVSEEARRLASPDYYRDYAYVSVFREPGGAIVGVVAGARDTGLRAIAPLVVGNDLPAELADVAGGGEGFEALFEITGQQGADLDEKLLVARARR